jgi:hypothetical protein
MSLTTFLNLKEVRIKFKTEFPKPVLEINSKILAEPFTNNYVLVGSAFDYLLRFYLQRLNGAKTIHSEWVASSVVARYQNRMKQKGFNNASSPTYIKTDLEIMTGIHNKAKEAHRLYLKNGLVTDQLLGCAYGLAQIDHFFRSGYIDPNLGHVQEKDMKDLKNLLLVAKNTNIKAKVCVLNPTFGQASQLVCGADTDLILDNTIVDIKTTKFLELTRDQYNQLIGYYCLYKLGGIDGLTKRHKIKSLGIYYSRFGKLATFSVEEFEKSSKFIPFLKWFKKTAKMVFK